MRIWRVPLVVALALTVCGGAHPAGESDGHAQARESFASEIAALSEPGGYFDTDNLISNERSYLHVMPELVQLHGGAYIGVGPDQNFSYIAAVRPAVAFIVDIRRDNLLLHLLFKALFATSRTRTEYLAHLTGRAAPESGGAVTTGIDAIAAAVDRARALDAGEVTTLRAAVTAAVAACGVPLTAADRDTIDRFHRQFIAAGLSLQFHSTGRAPQRFYPTYRDLLLETDRAGARKSFLASDDNFQFVKSLEARDLVIPVVGDLSGPAALLNIGRWLSAHHETLSAFYTSNVEYYLFRDGTFPRFIANLGRIPHTPDALVIRSFFDGSLMPPPGYGSASATARVQTLLDGVASGQIRSYGDLARMSGR